MEKTIEFANKKLIDPFSKTLFTILMISYIQPFEDGNKRASRLLGNAVLLSGDICPLSYRSINEAYYKKAVILFTNKTAPDFSRNCLWGNSNSPSVIIFWLDDCYFSFYNF